MEEFDIDIVHCPKRQHGNVYGLPRAYKGAGDVLEDDGFLDAIIMIINVKEMFDECQKTI
jgi:hypothetical protein